MSYKEFAVNDSLDNQDGRAFSPVERILGHFLWEAGPMLGLWSRAKKLVAWSINENFVL